MFADHALAYRQMADEASTVTQLQQADSVHQQLAAIDFQHLKKPLLQARKALTAFRPTATSHYASLRGAAQQGTIRWS